MIQIISFGYGHGPAPTADAVYDLRTHFRDPHVNPALRGLTAADPRVVDTVMATPGITDLIDSIVGTAHAYAQGPAGGPVTIAVGCIGGRHRSATVATRVAQMLAATVTHRDIHRPVINR